MNTLGQPRFFPHPELADDEGVLMVGGELTPAWLLDAYRHGIFPWPYVDGREYLLWWSPNPRAVFDLSHYHVSRRLWRTCQSGKFRVTCDRAFRGVMEGCATTGGRQDQTWITPALMTAFLRFHELGYAHSIEVWQSEELIGGTYGVAIGGFWAGESMFFLRRDASKVALAHLVHHLRQRGFCLFDIQQLTPHTQRLGGREIPRAEYLARLAEALKRPASFGDELSPLPPRWSDHVELR